MTEIHQAVYRAIGDELLWAASMPCRLPADDAIPIGYYGTSNVGRTKSVYRMGLSHRYGRRMQTISGIHYNFSLPQPLSNDAYFGLIRNFRRQSWLLLYLFGASPCVCSSFVAGREHQLKRWSGDTLYLPYATSLRMGNLGYQSDAQSALCVSYNNLESYAASLHEAMTQPLPGVCGAWAFATATATINCRTACCRSKTSSTARSGPSVVSARASVRCTRCANAVSSTSRCG